MTPETTEYWHPSLCPQNTRVHATFPYATGFVTQGELRGEWFHTVHGSRLEASKMTGWKT